MSRLSFYVMIGAAIFSFPSITAAQPRIFLNGTGGRCRFRQSDRAKSQKGALRIQRTLAVYTTVSLSTVT